VTRLGVICWPCLGGYRATPADLLGRAEHRLSAAPERRLVRTENELLREECAGLAADLTAVSVFLTSLDEFGDADAAAAVDRGQREVVWPEREARRG
jgi:hypothetical protein